MGIRERRARQKNLLRQEILDAARELLVREGYEHLSMRKVAERIDYSPTAIYLHFKDKRELVASLCQETFAKLIRELERIRSENGDPVVELRKGMRKYIEFGLAHPDHYVPTFVQPVEDLAAHRQRVVEEGESSGIKALGYLRDGIERGIKAKKLRRVDPDVAARATWAALHGITSLLITQKEFPWGDRNDVIDALLDVLIEGLKR